MAIGYAKKFWLFSLMSTTCLTACFAEEEEAEQVPTSFVRDVMQPFGVPVVSSFHAVRESLFLNAEFRKGTPLEKLGNLLLAPSRYVFAGKTIEVKDEQDMEFDVKQSYSYQNWHWLKWTCSLLALPLTEVLGVSVKGISYLAPEVRDRHSSFKKTIQTTGIVSNEAEYQKLGITELKPRNLFLAKGTNGPLF